MKTFLLTKTQKIVSIFAVVGCFLLGALSFGIYSYLAPVSYVSMDVNPSIEYTLNTFDRVLAVRPVNEDAVKILQAENLANLNHLNIDEALKLTLDELSQNGYLDEDTKNGVVIATSSKENETAEALAVHLGEVVTTQCTEHNQAVSVETRTVEQAQRNEANTLGVTSGKLRLVQELQEEYPKDLTFSADEWLAKSVKEILAELERLDALEDASEDATEDIEDDTDDAEDETEEDDTDEDDTDDIEDASEDAKEALEDASEDAKEALEDASEDAKEALEDASEDAKEALEDAAELAKEAAEKEREAAEKLKDEADDAADEAADIADAADDQADDDAENEADDAADAEDD
ncbi:MAG: hypothetical protein RR238_03560 [Lachnospiraceae bacterium]